MACKQSINAQNLTQYTDLKSGNHQYWDYKKGKSKRKGNEGENIPGLEERSLKPDLRAAMDGLMD